MIDVQKVLHELTDAPFEIPGMRLPSAAFFMWKTREVKDGLVGEEVIVMRATGYGVQVRVLIKYRSSYEAKEQFLGARAKLELDFIAAAAQKHKKGWL